ncbi:FAD binding domain-containing protein [Cordyceps fumosorosea ARSEF 2679]|uniref:FAD binding domain-containing protein n=1 Tax=Cordyceps fumosorosea (strain ARSEF 2679) TaxID=1081104 RepID=A0A167PLI4_CORFA|nr:FAD binding domain-containing protein [Cordyceps fumosorosea ARSEF 2679]OAA56783.1 FAD binding domain-containing protein [Cordyceps fumosorosea ARSEF 2679]
MANLQVSDHGQGGAQGIEDGLVLGIAMLGAQSRSDVQGRFGAYQEVRRCRASVIQVLSNVGQDQARQLKHEVLPYLEEDEIPTNPAQIQQFNFGYDAVEAAVGAMRRRDAGFALPGDFFNCPVVGVPPRKTPPAVVGRGVSHCGGEMVAAGRAAVEIS